MSQHSEPTPESVLDEVNTRLRETVWNHLLNGGPFTELDRDRAVLYNALMDVLSALAEGPSAQASDEYQLGWRHATAEARGAIVMNLLNRETLVRP